MGKKSKPAPGDLTGDQVTEELEEGLEETFPASDPPAATQPVHHTPKKQRDD